MGDEQHGGVLLSALPVDELGDAALVAEVERDERLVAEQQGGVGGDRLPDAGALLLAAGQFGDRGVGERGGTDLVEDPVDPSAFGPARGRIPQRDPVTPCATMSRARSGVPDSMRRCCGMYPILRCPRRTGCPRNDIVPLVRRCCPRTVRSSEVLPAPFGPSTATNSPGARSRSRCDQSAREPYDSAASRRASTAEPPRPGPQRFARGLDRGHFVSAPVISSMFACCHET